MIWVFDEVGNLIQEKQVAATDSIVTNHEYDFNGNLIKTTYNDGTENWLEYDVTNTLTKIIYEKDEFGVPLHYCQYSYNALGNRTYSKEFKRVTMPIQEGQLTADVLDIVDETTFNYDASKYTYTKIDVGDSHSCYPLSILSHANKEDKIDIQTHAAYDSTYNNDVFSTADKKYIGDLFKVYLFLGTPNGSVRYYNHKTKVDVMISVKIPYDSKHPDYR